MRKANLPVARLLKNAKVAHCLIKGTTTTSSHLLQRSRDLLCPYGVIVTARDIRWMKENFMHALLTVGSSSVEQPVYLELNYCSDPDPHADPYIMIGQLSYY